MVDQAGDSADSTFVVQTPVTVVQAKRSNPGASSSLWTLPTQNSITFRACLQDVAKLQPIVSQSFVVHGENGDHSLTTDPAGCLNWTENVHFDFLQDETYVQADHWIEGGGGPYRGRRHVPLAVDPWLESSDAGVDLRQGQTSVPRLAQARVQATEGGRVVLPMVTLQSNDIRYSGSSANLALSLELKPTLRRKNLDGELVQEPIHSGQFELSLTLLDRNPGASGTSEDRLIILSEQTLQVSASDDRILVTAPMQLKEKPKDTAILELAFSLKPLNAPVAILAQEGRIQLGGLRGGDMAPVLPVQEGFVNYLSKARVDTQAREVSKQQNVHLLSPDQTPPSVACSDGSDQLGYFIQTIQVQNLGVSSRTQTAHVPNEVLAGLTVCLANTMDRKPITDQDFQIRFGSDTQQLRTDVNGCFRFTEKVSLDYYAPESWKTQTLTITSAEAPFKDVTREFPVSIDPWSPGEEFFWDCRHGKLPEFRTQPARLEMISFSSSFMGRDFAMDPAMNLILNRHYQLQMVPRLTRTKGFSGLVTYETVTDGKYHLRVLMLAPKKDGDLSKIENADLDQVISNYNYLSSYEGDVQARDGQIVQEVTFPVLFQELPVLATRNILLVQLSPLDAQSNLVSQPFYLPFTAGLNGGYFGLIPSSGTSGVSSSGTQSLGAQSLDLAQLIELGKRSKNAVTTEDASLEQMAAKSGLTLASAEQLQKSGISSDVLSKLFSASGAAPKTLATLKRFCELIKGIAEEKQVAFTVAGCLKDPAASLSFTKIKHVEAVNAAPMVLESNFSNLQVSAQISVQSSNTRASSNGTSASTGQTDAKGTNETRETNKHGTANVGVAAKAGGGWHFLVDVEAGATSDASVGTGWSKGKEWFSGDQNFTTQQSTDSNLTTRAKVGVTTASDSYVRYFGIEEITLGIQGATRTCLGVRLKTSARQGPLGALICEQSANLSRPLNESYYLVSEMPGNVASPLRDTQSQSDAPWTKAIRGRAAFEKIRKFLQDKTRSLVLTPQSVDVNGLEIMDDKLNSFARTTPPYSDGAFPAVIR